MLALRLLSARRRVVGVVAATAAGGPGASAPTGVRSRGRRVVAATAAGGPGAGLSGGGYFLITEIIKSVVTVSVSNCQFSGCIQA